jgi:magnesium transporter
MRPLTSLILPEIRDFLAKGERDHLRTALEDMHPADIADIAENLDRREAAALIAALDLEVGIETFEQISPELQVELIEAIGRERLVRILDGMNPDDRAALARRLPEKTVEALLPLLAQAERNDVRRLLQYPEDTAGALMTTEYVALPGDLRVDQALAKIREIAPDRETIYYIYVVDAERHLRGVCSLRDIITALPRKALEEIMRERPITVNARDDREIVARTFEKYDLAALPVIDDEGRLVGIITVDDVLDVLEEEATEDLYQAGGVGKVDLPYFAAGFWFLVRKRASWLVILFIEELLTGTALRAYQTSLEKVVALMFFVPLIISSGGNSGSQSATLVTRALALGDVRMGDALKVFAREGAMGIVLGLILGAIGVLRAIMWGNGMGIAGVVGLSLVLVVLTGTVVGSLLPIGLRRLGFDPAVSSSPFIASLVDVMGLVIYFNVAKWVLALG